MNPDRLEFFVAGLPAPQGSKKHVGNGVMVESSKKVKPWREDVRHGATEAACGRVFTGPVFVVLDFRLPQLASDPHRHQHRTTPDLDKLVRSTFDAIVSAGVLKDDALVYSLVAEKHHARNAQRPGVTIVIYDKTELAAGDRSDSMLTAALARKAARKAS